MGRSVIFVHGLRGHRTKTWTKDGVCWPMDLLSQEEALSHIRILSFGYDANIVNYSEGRVSVNNIFDHSGGLLSELDRVRDKDAVSVVNFQEFNSNFHPF